MPQIDQDLYQLLVLVLGALNLLVLLLAVSQLSKIRGTLAAPPAAARAFEPAGLETQTAAPAAGTAETAGSHTPAATGRRAEPEPQQARREPEPQPALAAQPAGGYAPEPASLYTEEPASVYGSGGAPASTEPAAQEPAAQQPVQAQPAAQEPVQDQPVQQTVPADEPQEQPFERDGRWWFRRGDELLVYEESTGQWVPAPVQAAPAPSPAPAQTQAVTAQGEAESGAFWRCPQCGAVNGATAATCRMCFSPKPA